MLAFIYKFLRHRKLLGTEEWNMVTGWSEIPNIISSYMYEPARAFVVSCSLQYNFFVSYDNIYGSVILVIIDHQEYQL